MPDSTYLEERPNHRRSLVRRAALLTPAALLSTALFVVALVNLPASLFAFIILVMSTVALDIEAVAALRDLPARPVRTQGPATRVWKKSRYVVVGQVYYVLVQGRLFEIDVLTAAQITVGAEVVVEHWPHSNIVISLARAGTASPAQRSAPRLGEPERP